MWFGFQYNLSDSSDDDLDRFEQYSWDHILVHPKKNQGCLRVRPDANANANVNRSKTICRSPAP